MKEEELIQKIKNIYQEKASEIIKYLSIQPPKSFRVNTLKVSEEETIFKLKKEGCEIILGPLKNSYIFLSGNNSLKLSENLHYLNNEIYIQELSSMLPALILNIKKNDNILDLCAAPGSKTTQIISLMNNKVNVVSVEKEKNRFFKMKQIINDQGCKNVKTILEDANYLPIKYKEYNRYFDKIILDAPCSNEASINLNDKSTLKYWSKSTGKHISKLQKGLINTALKLLKSKGVLIYSTCTFSVEENELVLDWILKRNPNLKIAKINLNIKNITPGLTMWKDRILDKKISNSVRILPNEYFKGFFIAKIIQP